MNRTKLSMQELREKYPDFGTTSCQGKSYCVGGALCQEIGYPNSWPLTGELADVLESTNPELSPDSAWTYALRIINANDEADFDSAWVWLQAAMTYRRTI